MAWAATLPTPTPTATASLPTPTLLVAATMPVLLSHAPMVPWPPMLLPRGRLILRPTPPTLSALTLLNTDSQGPTTETPWSTPPASESAPTTWVPKSHAKHQTPRTDGHGLISRFWVLLFPILSK